MTTTLTRTALATAITINRTEGWANETNQPIAVTGPNVFTQADRVLQDMAYTAPHPGRGHHKTDVTITFDDGTSFTTCYLLAFHNRQRLADQLRDEYTHLTSGSRKNYLDTHRMND